MKKDYFLVQILTSTGRVLSLRSYCYHRFIRKFSLRFIFRRAIRCPKACYTPKQENRYFSLLVRFSNFWSDIRPFIFVSTGEIKHQNMNHYKQSMTETWVIVPLMLLNALVVHHYKQNNQSKIASVTLIRQQ